MIQCMPAMSLIWRRAWHLPMTVHAHLNLSANRIKQRYEVRADTCHIGNAGRHHLPQRKKGVSPKLASNWNGPYLVHRQVSHTIYEIRKSLRSKPRIVHWDRLWKYNSDKPLWFQTTKEHDGSGSVASSSEEHQGLPKSDAQSDGGDPLVRF